MRRNSSKSIIKVDEVEDVFSLGENEKFCYNSSGQTLLPVCGKGSYYFHEPYYGKNTMVAQYLRERLKSRTEMTTHYIKRRDYWLKNLRLHRIPKALARADYSLC